MPYTFGAAVTDNIAMTGLPLAPMTTARVGIHTCWVFPTTLTAGRFLWAFGTIMGLSINATTSSVTLNVDGTTDGTYTAPVVLALNTWTYIAVLWNLGTGPAAAVRMWSGTESTGPIERTVTAVAATGAFVSGGTGWTIGNTSAGSVAFQGDIGSVFLAADSAATAGLNSICSILPDGTLSQAQADLVRARFVDPLWRGDLPQLGGYGRTNVGFSTFGFSRSGSLDTATAGGAWMVREDATPTRATLTGVSDATRRGPRPFQDQMTNPMMARGGAQRGYLVRA